MRDNALELLAGRRAEDRIQLCAELLKADRVRGVPVSQRDDRPLAVGLGQRPAIPAGYADLRLRVVGSHAARPILALYRLRKLRRYLGDLRVGATNRTDAAALADAIELGNGLVEASPGFLGAAAAAARLQLVGRR